MKESEIFIPVTAAIDCTDWKEAVEKAFAPWRVLELDGHYDILRIGFVVTHLRLSKPTTLTLAEL